MAAANALNIAQAGLVHFDGINAFTAVTVTQYATLVGGSSNTITSLSLGTLGQFLRSNGAGADPSYESISNSDLPGSGEFTLTAGTNIDVSTSPVPLGGSATVSVTGPPSATSLTQYGVLYGNLTSAILATAAGTTNTVLLGNTGSAPTFGAVPNAALAFSSITLNNGNNITFTGSPVSLGGAATANLTGTTNHAVQVGNASGSLTSLPVGATGTLLNGHTGADPSFDTQTVGNYTFTKSTAGDGTLLTVSHTNNSNGLSDAGVMIQTGGASGGDTYFRAAQGTAQSYCWGIDHTDTVNKSIVWKSGANATTAPSSGDTTIASMTKDGVQTLPLQPGGSWTLGTPTANVTGDGTAVDVLFDNEAWQQGSNYNSGTGKFTCPIGGVYAISGLVTLNNLTGDFTSGELKILSSAGTYTKLLFNPGLCRDVSGNYAVVFAGCNKYNAGDTIYINISVSGGTKTVGIKELFFGGYTILNIMKVA